MASESSVVAPESLVRSWGCGVPPDASALHARWWQIETWVRELLYVELRSAYGPSWGDHVPNPAEKRKTDDEELGYMPTPDAEHRLAYLNPSPLFELAAQHWEQVGYALIDPVENWQSRKRELIKIRHRIGHCRRPHRDDLARLEQALRDLERGALSATTSLNEQRPPEQSLDLAPVAGWVAGEHEDAHLIQHAGNQYEIDFKLMVSRRPWTQTESRPGDRSGHVWHASWHFCDSQGSGIPDLGDFWSRLESAHPHILFVCSDDPAWVEVSFPMLEDEKKVSDLIGSIFDTVLTCRRRNLDSSLWETWSQRSRGLDWRIQVGTAWSLYDKSMRNATVFGAS